MSQADPNMKAMSPEDVEAMEHHDRRAKKEGSAELSNLNLTSMIDVVFQLLVYFVVTTSFAQGEGVIIAKLPKAGGAAAADVKPPERPLKIILSSTGMSGYRINLDGYPAAPRDFVDLNQTLLQLQYDPSRGLSGPYKQDNPIIIQPDGQVRWQHVVNAFNATVSARYKNVSFGQAQQ